MRPIITSPASIFCRDDESFLRGKTVGPLEQHYLSSLWPMQLEMGLDYVRPRSAVKDPVILLRTLRAILRR